MKPAPIIALVAALLLCGCDISQHYQNKIIRVVADGGKEPIEYTYAVDGKALRPWSFTSTNRYKIGDIVNLTIVSTNK